jgi:ParB family chromosome partitioning protein
MSKSDVLMQKFGATIAQAVTLRPEVEPAATAPGQDRYAGAVRARSFAEMSVDAIECDPQARAEFDPEDLRRLAESIRRFGQLAPIRARYDTARGRWVVLVGERRLRACRLAGLERVRVELVERDMTEADILAEQVVENAVRADLQPVEQARAFRRLMELNGWTAQQLAETLDVEPTAVYRSLGLLRLPEDVAARVDAGEIRPTAAYEISKLQIADEQREVAEQVVSNGLDHASTAAEVTRRRAAGGKPRSKGRGRRLTSKVFRTSAAKVSVELRKGEGLPAIREALAEALGRIDAEIGTEGRDAA